MRGVYTGVQHAMMMMSFDMHVSSSSHDMHACQDDDVFYLFLQKQKISGVYTGVQHVYTDLCVGAGGGGLTESRVWPRLCI